MERREAIGDSKKYQARPVYSKGDREGDVGQLNQVRNRDGEKHRDHDEKGYTRQGGAGLKPTKE